MSYKNPFAIDRAEQLGDRLYEFYSYHPNFQGLLKNKSLILEGGRGSGKTMFFLYHSYFNKKKEAISAETAFQDFFSKESLIGIYFRADSNFVPAFQHKGLDDEEWGQLFGHFLNISISKRLVEIIKDVNANFENNKIELDFSDELNLILNSPVDISNYDILYKVLVAQEINLISYINNIRTNPRPTIIGNGFLLNFIATNILQQHVLKNKSIHVFIDEYENLLPYQQRIVNTLIKHPSPVIFDVGMRTEGLKTYATFADNEIISAPHDYNHYNFEQFTASEYEDLLIDICKKRLSKVEELQDLQDSKYFDIRFYLGEYNMQDELQTLMNTKYEDSIRAKIKVYTGVTAGSEILYNIKDILLLRLNLVLLDRGKSVKTLIQEFSSFLNNKPSKYNDWIHNNKNGLIYLMCKENNGKEKLYYGFTTYKLMSSGIIRFFIELCESAFKNAYRNSFDFSNPRLLTSEEQTDAANYVSQYKVNDIETYTPYSNKLKRFVILLGNIFERLHRDRKQSETRT
jgi:hypothetical protein